MVLDKIITLANKKVYHRFIAMERSLRATGCTLPLYVIPYDDHIFDLPPNAQWVKHQELFDWVAHHQLKGVYRKYYCLLQQNFLFVDSDVIFLRHPQEALKSVETFITSCGHWHNPVHTTIPYSEAILKGLSTNWQSRVFNSGQFACSERLYGLDQLLELAQKHAPVCMAKDMHEQPGVNLLANLSGLPIVNLTLPPYQMESTWAGDYLMDDYEKYWGEGARKPFIIHWAGRGKSYQYKIDGLFLGFLNDKEVAAWKTVHLDKKPTLSAFKRNLNSFLKKSPSNLFITQCIP